MTFKYTFKQRLANFKVNSKRSLENAVNTAKMTSLIAVPLAVVAVAGTIAVNSLVYVAMATQEGIERGLGVTPTNYVARLVAKKDALGHSGNSMPYGIFELPNKERKELYDSAVVTEGKLFPGIVSNMETGKVYDVNVFGSPKWVQRIVNAREIK